MCHWRNSEFIDYTKSISQELQNIVNQYNDNDIVPQDEISWYIVVSIFWYTPDQHTWKQSVTSAMSA